MRFAKGIVAIAVTSSSNVKAEISFYPEYITTDSSHDNAGRNNAFQRLDGNHDWKIRSDDGHYLNIPAKVCFAYEYERLFIPDILTSTLLLHFHRRFLGTSSVT